jgi:hypothetical protein
MPDGQLQSAIPALPGWTEKTHDNRLPAPDKSRYFSPNHQLFYKYTLMNMDATY